MSGVDRPVPERSKWKQAVAKYSRSNVWLSLWQIANTFIPYFVLLYLMYRSLEVSYLLTLLLAIPAAAFAIRSFIIFHDCGHGSFFDSKKANDFVGIVAGILTFTPYYYWRNSHAKHHATSGDLDRRGTGDIWMLTLEEYEALPPRRQLWYRIYRNPLFLFGLAPAVLFLVMRRFPDPDFRKRERYSVHFTNAVLLAIIIVAALTIGLGKYIAIQLPVIVIAASAGVWMFYVQHQYPGVYWARHEDWDYVTASLYGSSYYKLPKLLQWVTGNIGFHHIHHLSPRIPNYYLEPCQEENTFFQAMKPLTLWESFKTANLRLLDEETGEMLDYHALRRPA